jgi:hypothetical protein
MLRAFSRIELSANWNDWVNRGRAGCHFDQREKSFSNPLIVMFVNFGPLGLLWSKSYILFRRLDWTDAS